MQTSKDKMMALSLSVIVLIGIFCSGCIGENESTPKQTNHAPVITAIPAQNTTVGTQFKYQVIATDADNDTLTYTTNIGNITNTGLFIYTPTTAGTYNITIIVNDAKTESTTMFALTVASPAPPSFSATVTDALDTISTYTSPTTNTSTWKRLGQVNVGTFTQGNVVAPRPYVVNGTSKAFAIQYYNATGGPLTEKVWINGTYNDEKYTTQTFSTIIDGSTTPFASGNWISVPLVSGSLGVKSLQSMTVSALNNGQAHATALSSVYFYANTPLYDTIVKIMVNSGKLGDITNLSFYIKVGAQSDWVKLTPDPKYGVGAVVLDNAATDTSWDVGETVYLSETSAMPNIIDYKTTSQQVYMKIICDPLFATIFQTAVAINVL